MFVKGEGGLRLGQRFAKGDGLVAVHLDKGRRLIRNGLKPKAQPKGARDTYAGRVPVPLTVFIEVGKGLHGGEAEADFGGKVKMGTDFFLVSTQDGQIVHPVYLV